MKMEICRENCVYIYSIFLPVLLNPSVYFIFCNFAFDITAKLDSNNYTSKY